MELSVWTSTTVRKIERDDARDEYVVTLLKSDGSKRVMRPKYVIGALGIGGGEPKLPDIPGMVRSLILSSFFINTFHLEQFPREDFALLIPQRSYRLSRKESNRCGSMQIG